MIIARSVHEFDTTGRGAWSAAAIAPHRGDVTTAMAAALVRARAAGRIAEAQISVASRGRAPAPVAGWDGAPSASIPGFALL